MPKDYLEDVKEEMLMHLADRPYTISVLADIMQKPYTTVQQAHKALRDEGKIAKFDRKQRGARYTISAGTGPTSTIPHLRVSNQNLKPTEIFRDAVGLPEQAKTKMNEVVKVWASIARMAQRLNDGTADFNAAGLLRRKQRLLLDARNSFEQMAFLCNQMIDSEALWDPESLSKFSLDSTWEDYLPFIDALYSFYYGDDND